MSTDGGGTAISVGGGGGARTTPLKSEDACPEERGSLFGSIVPPPPPTVVVPSAVCRHGGQLPDDSAGLSLPVYIMAVCCLCLPPIGKFCVPADHALAPGLLLWRAAASSASALHRRSTDADHAASRRWLARGRLGKHGSAAVVGDRAAD